MLTAKQRARVEQALATDPKGKPSPPPAAELLDWIEGRARRACLRFEGGDENLGMELAWRAERYLSRFGDTLRRDDADQVRRSIAALRWAWRAQTALVKGDSDALAFAVMMAERSLHDPAFERAERTRRGRLRRIAVRGGRSRGKPLLSRDDALRRAAGGLAGKHRSWSAASIAKELAKNHKLSARRIAAIIGPVVREIRGTTPA